MYTFDVKFLINYFYNETNLMLLILKYDINLTFSSKFSKFCIDFQSGFLEWANYIYQRIIYSGLPGNLLTAKFYLFKDVLHYLQFENVKKKFCLLKLIVLQTLVSIFFFFFTSNTAIEQINEKYIFYHFYKIIKQSFHLKHNKFE